MKINKIQFIIAGWHMNQPSLIDGLYELEQSNESVDVFWACHREPTEEIKNKFKHQLFYNGAEECGAYQQALDYLKLEDDVLIFFLHDDIIVKDWSFINVCIDRLNQGYRIIGNGMDYSDRFDPFKVTTLGITEQFDGAQFKDYVKDDCQHMFDSVLDILKVRPSFIAMMSQDVNLMGGFEPRIEAYVPPLVTKDEWCDKDEPHYRGTKGLGSFGNLFPALTCYKMNKVIGANTITYLSNSYVDSEYLYECQRGHITETHPIK
jgi:hypothetical protein